VSVIIVVRVCMYAWMDSDRWQGTLWRDVPQGFRIYIYIYIHIYIYTLLVGMQPSECVRLQNLFAVHVCMCVRVYVYVCA
jgi:hypothetical protein